MTIADRPGITGLPQPTAIPGQPGTVPLARGTDPSVIHRPGVQVLRGRDAHNGYGVLLYDRRLLILAALLTTPALFRPGWWVLAVLIVSWVATANLDAAAHRRRHPGQPPAHLPAGLITAIPRQLKVLVGMLVRVGIAMIAVGLVVAGIAAALSASRSEPGYLISARAIAGGLRGAVRWGVWLGLLSSISAGLRDVASPWRPELPPSLSHILDEVGALALTAVTAAAALLLLIFAQPTAYRLSPLDSTPGLQQANDALQGAVNDAAVSATASMLQNQHCAGLPPLLVADVQQPDGTHVLGGMAILPARNLATQLQVLSWMQDRSLPGGRMASVLFIEGKQRQVLTLNRDIIGQATVVTDARELAPGIVPRPNVSGLSPVPAAVCR